MPPTKKPEIPEGRRPEEFLNDAALARYYRSQRDAVTDKDSTEYAKADEQYRRAKRAAAMTSAAADDDEEE